MAARIPPNFRRVITAAAGGNVIEWYDFYIFGSLAAVLSVWINAGRSLGNSNARALNLSAGSPTFRAA